MPGLCRGAYLPITSRSGSAHCPRPQDPLTSSARNQGRPSAVLSFSTINARNTHPKTSDTLGGLSAIAILGGFLYVAVIHEQ